MEDVYRQLAAHLETLVMGYPYNDALLDLLKEMFNPLEARILLGIPNDLVPLELVEPETVAARCGVPEATVEETLASLAERRLVLSGTTPSGKTGYALLQVGYGMPQTFFWGGERSDRTRTMAGLVLRYFSVQTTGRVYGGTRTKAFKYTPATLRVEVPLQGVMPRETMEPIIDGAEKIAVAHCPCRMSASVLGRTDCPHSLEVCLKYDELAEFVVSRGIAREISKDEAFSILRDCEQEGLVHMVDNAQGEIKHTCNCCGCYCWNVGIIKRRKIPRDRLMAVHFIRETDSEACIACGACADICPVAAVELNDDGVRVDPDWCIGCGVCAVACPTGAVSIQRRSNARSPETFRTLHNQIKLEKGI